MKRRSATAGLRDSDEQLCKTYLAVCDEYNRSPLAMNDGWYHRPNAFTLIQLREVVKRVPAENAVFLDIGTGSGIVPRVVHKLGVHVISVDWPVTGTEKAILNLQEAGIEGYYCQVGHDPLPIPDGRVDCVLLADVIEHLLHSPKPVLAEISRVLRRGGSCIATTPNALRLTVRLKVPLGYSNWPFVFDYYDAPFHGGHHHEYTIDEFREVFRRAGFVEEAFYLHEARLGHTEVLGFDQIRTRSRRVRLVHGRMPLVLGAASRALALVTRAIPRLRSEMLIVTQKP